MAVSPFVKPLCLCLGTLGLIQGLILFALSLCGLLVHLCFVTVDTDETLSTFVPLVVGLYFQGADCQIYNTTILYNDYFTNLVTPEWLFPWIAVYVGVSGVWIVISILIMLEIIHKKKILHYFLLLWIILVLGNCGIDLALAIYFGSDYTNLISNVEVNGTSLLPVVPFAMMIFALKGGLLWLINFVSGIFAMVAYNNFVNHKDDNKPLFLEQAGYLDRSPINGFAPIEVPRPTTLHLNTNLNDQMTAPVSPLRNYYLNHQESRSGLQSPISEFPTLRNWGKHTTWHIPDPDYSPTSTVTGSQNATNSKSTGLRHSLFNPTLPLRPSLKKTQQNFERKEDISL